MSVPALPRSTPAPEPAAVPLAVIDGKPYTDPPTNLYIPPEALRVFLENFEGPLDLLLYLIKRENIDILDIPVARITEQYIQYIELMKELKLELAGEYLVMAAMLAELKSRMLLPRPAQDIEDEEDPRSELIRRVLEYERYRQAAADLDRLERLERELHPAVAVFPQRRSRHPPPQVKMEELLCAFAEVLERSRLFSRHQVQMEALSVRERMSEVLACLATGHRMEFSRLFPAREGRAGLIVTLLALLELLRGALIDLVQTENYGPIYVKAL